jgi:calcineurin-like phosphoesterase family protein
MLIPDSEILEEHNKPKERKTPHKKAIPMNQPNTIPAEDQIFMRKIIGLENEKKKERTTNQLTEIRTGGKKMVFKILSKTHTKDKAKFEESLNQSEYLNKYMDNQIYLSYIDSMNAHTKAGICFIYHYLNNLL